MTKQGTSIEKAQNSRPGTIKQWIEGDDFKNAVAKALPRHLSPDRFTRVALTSLMKVPKLKECTHTSVLKCMLDLSSLGLEPDGRMAHLIPYENKKAGTVECQLIIDYKGLIALAKRSGEVATWRAETVCENDHFKYKNGVVEHEIDFRKPRGNAYAFYSHVVRKDGVEEFEVMHMDDVLAIKKRSRAGQYGPWNTDFNEMAKKTVVRRHSKKLTLSAEFVNAVDKDDDQIEFENAPTYEDLKPTAINNSDDLQIEAYEEEQEDFGDGPIDQEGLQKIMDAVKDNPAITKPMLMEFVKDAFEVEKLTDLQMKNVQETVEYIQSVCKEPGSDG